MDEDEGETDCETCEVACAYLAVSGSENYEDEEEGGYDFYQECTTGTAGTGDTVTSETCRVGTCESCRRSHDLGEEEEQGTGDDGTDDLADPVSAGILPAHTSGKGDAKGDGRVDVATGDTADCVSHCYH